MVMQTATNRVQMCPLWPCVVRVWEVTDLVSHVMNIHEKALKSDGIAKILADWEEMRIWEVR